MASVVLLPTPPPPPAPGAPTTLAHAERETASRLGPFYALAATGGAPDAVLVAGLRSNAPLGGYEGLYLLRREAPQATDRVRTVDRVDGPSGALVVDFPYTGSPAAGEPVELHHLHPDLQLFPDVQAALRRCYLLDTLVVEPPPDGAVAAAVATVREVGGPSGNGEHGGWLVWNPGWNGDGDGALVPSGSGPLNGPGRPLGNGLLSTRAGLTSRATREAPAAVVDLTAQAFWLTATRQILSVAVDGAVLPPCGRYGASSPAGYQCYASRGHVYLALPAGVPLDTITVRAYRDAFGLVDGVDDPAGPVADDDELAVPVDYVAAMAHAEAWRRHRDRLEAAAAEMRLSTMEQAAAEATRVASIYADFLFRPQSERGDPIGSPWGSAAKPSPSGLGGYGALAGAVVNHNYPRD